MGREQGTAAANRNALLFGDLRRGGEGDGRSDKRWRRNEDSRHEQVAGCKGKTRTELFWKVASKTVIKKTS